MRKTDAKRFVGLLKRHRKEIYDLLMSNNEIAYETFLYEMDNHEYAINWDGDWDVLNSLGLDEDDLEKMGLQFIYNKARREHFKHAEEWGMI